uniref:Uncharacterized protein n=1 Tax=Arundo donax TaxID=35708 RepID=A0A0A8ZCL7_ARUDO
METKNSSTNPVAILPSMLGENFHDNDLQGAASICGEVAVYLRLQSCPIAQPVCASGISFSLEINFITVNFSHSVEIILFSPLGIKESLFSWFISH